MRPTAQRQSAFRMPLNEILGTEANVRLLRVLADRHTSLSAAELARQAQLQPSTVHRSLKTLEELGVVEFIGTASQPQIMLRERGTLVKALRLLFTEEGGRFDALLNELRQIVQGLTPPPRSAWLSRDSVDQPEPGHPIDLYIVDDADRVDFLEAFVSVETEKLQRKHDVEIAVHAWTVADIEALPTAAARSLADAILIVGVPPSAYVDTATHLYPSPEIRSHLAHDNRARVVAAQIAHVIRKDPSFVDNAREFVERRWATASSGERKELAEWRKILRTTSPARIRKLLLDGGERSTRLLQTMPFVGAVERLLRDREHRAAPPASRPKRRTRKP